MIWLIIFIIFLSLMTFICKLPIDLILKFGSCDFSFAGSLSIKIKSIKLKTYWFSYNVCKNHKLFCNFRFPLSSNKKQNDIPLADAINIIKKAKLHWSLKVMIGTEDAAVLSILTGLLRSLIISFAAVSLNILPWQTQKIIVVPCYGTETLKTGFSCIVSIRLGQIIFEVIKSLIRSAQKR